MIKILIIDDEQDICDYVGEFFVRRGHEVVTESRPLKAMEAVEENSHQLFYLIL